MKVHNLGLINYQESLDFQIERRDAVINGSEEESLIVCSHNPVVTLGKKSTPEDLLGWQGDVVEVSRGGKATYHGPGQLIIYPIINIQKRNNDLYWYLRTLEVATINTLENFKLTAMGDSTATGVWIDNLKVASIGIAIKRWVTYHGIAINLESDPLAFQGIRPCGFQTSTMTSLEQLLKGEDFNRELFSSKMIEELVKRLKVGVPGTELIAKLDRLNRAKEQVLPPVESDAI